MTLKTKHPLYIVWVDMRRRCMSPTARHYSHYGGRGIQVCPEWDDFFRFVDDMGPRPAGYQIDRIDVNGNYEPSNCRWASRKEQQRNRRDTRHVTISGRDYLAVELAEQYGLKQDTIVDRAAKGMTFAQVTARRRYVDTSGLSKAIETRVAKQLARTHCKNGHPWSDENTRIGPTGGRECRACARIKMQRIRDRRRAS